MSLRSPLSTVRGLGSARRGTEHWWQQRITAVALVPLGLWLLPSVARILPLGHDVVVQWIQRPLNAVLLVLFLAALFHHTHLGLQVVIEDYVEPEWQKIASIMLVRFLSVIAGTASVIAVLSIYMGG